MAEILGIFKENEISGLGGVTPQTDNVELAGQLDGWSFVKVDETKVSSIQEFNVQYIDNSIAEGLGAPESTGAYNAEAYKVGGYGDKLRPEVNPGQQYTSVDGKTVTMTSPDDLDDKSQKNFSEEDVKPYKQAIEFIKKYTAKTILRDGIRSEIKDLGDDIADTKRALKTTLYYFLYEWKNRTDAERSQNPNRASMNALANKLLNDEEKTKLDIDSSFGKMIDIMKDEDAIQKYIKENYKYENERGVK